MFCCNSNILFSVGKTSLINQFVHGKFSNKYRASVGIDFSNKEIFVNDAMYAVQFCDTAGKESLVICKLYIILKSEEMLIMRIMM